MHACIIAAAAVVATQSGSIKAPCHFFPLYSFPSFRLQSRSLYLVHPFCLSDRVTNDKVSVCNAHTIQMQFTVFTSFHSLKECATTIIRVFVLRLPLIVSGARCVSVYALHQHYVYTRRNGKEQKGRRKREKGRIEEYVCERLANIFLVKINSINFPFSLDDSGTKGAKIEKELNLKCVCVYVVRVVCVYVSRQ